MGIFFFASLLAIEVGKFLCVRIGRVKLFLYVYIRRTPNKNVFTCRLSELSKSTNNNELAVVPCTQYSIFFSVPFNFFFHYKYTYSHSSSRVRPLLLLLLHTITPRCCLCTFSSSFASLFIALVNDVCFISFDSRQVRCT